MISVIIFTIHIDTSRMNWPNWFLRCQWLLSNCDWISVNSLFLTRKFTSWIFILVLLKYKTTRISPSWVGSSSSLCFWFFFVVAIVWMAIVIKNIFSLIVLIGHYFLVLRIIHPSSIHSDIISATNLSVSKLFNPLWSCNFVLVVFLIILAHSSNNLSSRFSTPSFSSSWFFRIHSTHSNWNFLRQLFCFNIRPLVISFLTTFVITWSISISDGLLSSWLLFVNVHLSDKIKKGIKFIN